MNAITKEQAVPASLALPETLPAGARAFQAAVDGKLTTDVWNDILEAQIKKAKEGDRSAAKFLLEYAGGVASMRGATFVQQTHHHQHYYEADGDAPATVRRTGEQTGLSPAEWEARKNRNARRVAARAGGGI